MNCIFQFEARASNEVFSGCVMTANGPMVAVNGINCTCQE